MSPASIFETKFAQAKASISHRATVRRVRITRCSPSSMPPYPAQSPRCVIVLGLSTLFLSLHSVLVPLDVFPHLLHVRLRHRLLG